jgi:hypothetical protein
MTQLNRPALEVLVGDAPAPIAIDIRTNEQGSE